MKAEQGDLVLYDLMEAFNRAVDVYYEANPEVAKKVEESFSPEEDMEMGQLALAAQGAAIASGAQELNDEVKKLIIPGTLKINEIFARVALQHIEEEVMAMFILGKFRTEEIAERLEQFGCPTLAKLAHRP